MGGDRTMGPGEGGGEGSSAGRFIFLVTFCVMLMFPDFFSEVL